MQRTYRRYIYIQTYMYINIQWRTEGKTWCGSSYMVPWQDIWRGLFTNEGGHDERWLYAKREVAISAKIRNRLVVITRADCGAEGCLRLSLCGGNEGNNNNNNNANKYAIAIKIVCRFRKVSKLTMKYSIRMSKNRHINMYTYT